jgi:hypothetical protein
MQTSIDDLLIEKQMVAVVGHLLAQLTPHQRNRVLSVQSRGSIGQTQAK